MLKLAQERMDLQDELASLTAEDDLDELITEFFEDRSELRERQGISYAAWREAGVLRDGLIRAS